MGLPEVVIEFQEKRSNFIHRLGRGMVAIPFVGASFTTSVVAVAAEADDVETSLGEGFPADQKETVTAEMLRAINNGASKVIAVCAKDVTTAQSLLAAQRFNYLAIGGLEDTDQTSMVTWAKGKKYCCGRNFIIIGGSALAEEPDYHIVALDDVNLTDPDMTTAAIAGILAGLSRESGTYYVVDRNTDGTGYATEDQADSDNDDGIITVFYDGEKAKLSRAVTTYYAEDPDSAYAKIRNVDAMNMIIDDITDSFIENYVGKVLNSYDKKMAMVGIINQNYLGGLANDVLDPDGVNKVDVDVEAHKELAKTIGEDVSTMTEMELRKYPTGAKVFLAGSVRFLDTMEDLKIIFVIE